ncbi:MAG TPA: hypothetical protein VGP55_13190 [Chitinophagaceae bacterium]|nr:hypothetical protein [Chitinophagaceae bacterium]
MDTFARYVLKAPYIDEVKRKDTESHYPYWFQYRNTFVPEKTEKNPGVNINNKRTNVKAPNKKRFFFIAIIILITGLVFLVNHFLNTTVNENFSDDFHSAG